MDTHNNKSWVDIDPNTVALIQIVLTPKLVDKLRKSCYELNSKKKVLIPDMNAGCFLEDSCPADKFEKCRNKYPNHVVSGVLI